MTYQTFDKQFIIESFKQIQDLLPDKIKIIEPHIKLIYFNYKLIVARTRLHQKSF